MNKLKVITFVVLIISAVQAHATTYWVSKTGSDSNNCLTQSTGECASIQKAISLAQSGDTVYIKAGTYTEVSATSAYTTPCMWFSSGPASLCIKRSGTKSNPIVISSAPGVADGTVIIDSQNIRVGIQVNGFDYINFSGLKFINNLKYAIVNDAPDNQNTHTVSASNISVGVIIQNCIVDGVLTAESGDNIGALGPWGTQDWVIRNNFLTNVVGGSGIRAYGIINIRVEHNTITNVSEGILWKDHFVKNDTTRGFYTESEIAYNYISAYKFGINVQTRGTGSSEAGHNYIHHNIFTGFNQSEPECIHYVMSDAGRISGNLRIVNNTCDTVTTDGVALTLSASNKVELYGNIFLRYGLGIFSAYVDTVSPKITASDYNVFMGNQSNLAALDRYSTAPQAIYQTLTNWKAALDSQSLSLAMNNPDTHSAAITYNANLWNQTDSTLPYRLTGANPGIALLPTGKNAGAYENGTEIIGRLNPVTAKATPKPPTQ
jgi:hypothetical protein